jgi:hypothetical protein
MATRRPSVRPAVGVREALIAKLAGHVRETVDPRLLLVPQADWPDPLPVYADPRADMLADLVAGRAVDVWPHMLRGIVEVPRGARLVRVDVDGSLAPAPYERLE